MCVGNVVHVYGQGWKVLLGKEGGLYRGGGVVRALPMNLVEHQVSVVT